jgi:hypothetical protein
MSALGQKQTFAPQKVMSASDARADAPNNPKTAATVSKNVFTTSKFKSICLQKLNVRFANNDSNCRSRDPTPLIQFSVLCYVCHTIAVVRSA